MTENITQLLDDASARVDSALETFLQKDATAVENLHDGLLYSLGLDQEDPAIRGKRIRPALCLIACECLGGKGEAALPFGMAVELMHNFFLVHDDIQDGDPFRRGRPSAWKRYGIAHSINIGDFLFTKVFDAFLSGADAVPDLNLQFSLLKLLVETLEYTHIGQAQDMNALRRRDMTLEDYLEIVTNKTGYYLAAPMLGGAQIAGATPETLEALRQLGKFVGPVFQIVDDTIDLTHGKGRDTVGSDIREGKRSYLAVYAASKATPEEREELYDILDLPREETSRAHIQRVAAIYEKYGAIEAGQAYCKQLMEQAHAAMQNTPERLRDTMLAIFDHMLERKK
jgi:geranylgeranyl pyrophosphate synthase